MRTIQSVQKQLRTWSPVGLYKSNLELDRQFFVYTFLTLITRTIIVYFELKMFSLQIFKISIRLVQNGATSSDKFDFKPI